MRARTLLGLSCLIAICTSANATILTFDIAGISNGQNMNPGYGDAVTATTMGSFGYGVGTEGFTPDVQATYGTNDPALWTTGYGNLTNILFEDQDSSGILRITLSGSGGFGVNLYEFRLAAFSSSFSADPVVQSITITNGGSTTYYTASNTIVSETTSTLLDFSSSPIFDTNLVITIDARNLGSLNDDIGVDNLRFGQQPVPEPTSLAALGLGAAALLRRRKTSRS